MATGDELGLLATFSRLATDQRIRVIALTSGALFDKATQRMLAQAFGVEDGKKLVLLVGEAEE